MSQPIPEWLMWFSMAPGLLIFAAALIAAYTAMLYGAWLAGRASYRWLRDWIESVR